MHPTSLLQKGTISEGKIQGQKLFCHSKLAVAKVHLCEKHFWVSGTLITSIKEDVY